MNLRRLRAVLRHLIKQTHTLVLIYRHPQTPWYIKVLAAGVVAYALSPLDLIPDVIPIIGHLDDLLIVPLGIWLVMRLTPSDLWAECRQRAEREPHPTVPRSWVVAAGVLAIWVVIGVVIALGLHR
ncbi:MAG: DUF1232 domain-containing protein [Gloeomargaritaceae cyanobacterium C42_A2020_066]|nr:DUF1232 domain-containing protein [Gloeomargaritaceae cyanobacterium C42_A2020_066]